MVTVGRCSVVLSNGIGAPIPTHPTPQPDQHALPSDPTGLCGFPASDCGEPRQTDAEYSERCRLRNRIEGQRSASASVIDAVVRGGVCVAVVIEQASPVSLPTSHHW